MSVSRAAHSSRKPHSCKKQFLPKACLSKLYDKHLVFSAQDCKHWSQSEVKIDPNVLPRKSLCSSVKELNSVKLEGLDPSKIVEIKQKKREFFMSYTFSHSRVCKCEKMWNGSYFRIVFTLKEDCLKISTSFSEMKNTFLFLLLIYFCDNQ